MRLPAPALIALLFIPASCLESEVEVQTEVSADGSLSRTVRITSLENGNAADHPKDLTFLNTGWSAQGQEAGHTHIQAWFPSAKEADAGIAFGSGGSKSASETTFVKQDWFFFERFQYEEAWSPGVTADGIHEALDEVALVISEVVSETFVQHFGNDFEGYLLHQRLQTDLRRMMSEFAFLAWKEVTSKNPQEDRFFKRTIPVMRRYGLNVQSKWFAQGLNGSLSYQPEIMMAVSDWIGKDMRPVQKDGRQSVIPDMQSFLFDGLFEELFMQQLENHFAGEDELDDWAQEVWDSISGPFGPSRTDALSFHFQVEMPGDLLKTDGWIGNGPKTFLEIPGDAFYPSGQQMRCESVQWKPAISLGGHVAYIERNNRTALALMSILGDGPSGSPQKQILEVLKECEQVHSLEPLVLALEEGVWNATPLNEKAEELLNWLEGERG